MAKRTSRFGIMTLPGIAGAVLLLALALLAVRPTLGGTPTTAQATATPVATQTPALGRILFSGCPIDPQSWDRTRCNHWGIYEVNSDGTGLRELLARGDDNPGPLTVSPDGRRVLFYVSVYREPPPNAPGVDRDAYRGFKRRLLDLPTQRESDLPDDIDLCQWVTAETAVCSVRSVDNTTRGLYVIDFDTGSREKILTGFDSATSIQNFSVSPDGRQLLVATRSLEGHLPQTSRIVATLAMIAGTERADLLTILGEPGHPADVAWSPSGQWIVVQADTRFALASFWMGDTQNWDLRKAAELPGIVTLLDWSADEREVLVHACDRQTGERFGRIVAIGRDKTSLRTLMTLRGPQGVSAKACGRGRLSLDQTSFLFWFPAPAAPSEQLGLYVTNGTLNQVKRVLSGYTISDAIWLRSPSNTETLTER